MAIVEFVNKPNRSYKGLSNVIQYALRDDKNIDHLVHGIGVNPSHAYAEFVAMKNIMGKTDKRLWYHFVQSFPPYDNVTPELALEVADRLVEYFKGEYQILIAVHQDKAHIHTHFILNTVNMVTGKKYTQNKNQMKEIQAFSDQICEEYGLHTLSEGQRGTSKYKKAGEYRTIQNGTSWKVDLQYAIDISLQYACSREHFIYLMRAQGYGVRWEDSRKNITFTTPSGMKCRDRKLGDDSYYNKQNFEMIFNINASHKEHERVTPYVFEVLDSINAIMSGNGTTMQMMDVFHIETEGLSYEDIILLYKRLQGDREYLKLIEMMKEKEAAYAASMEQLWERIEDVVRWIASREDDMDYEVGREEYERW